jgi:hypothetical protein
MITPRVPVTCAHDRRAGRDSHPAAASETPQ